MLKSSINNYIESNSDKLVQNEGRGSTQGAIFKFLSILGHDFYICLLWNH